jgi:hypothetical protein
MFGDFRLVLSPGGGVYGSWYKSRSRCETRETKEQTANPSIYTCQSVKSRNSPLRKDSSGSRKEKGEGKVGYGAVGKSNFSKYARRKILHAGAVLDSDYQPSDCLFLTLTLPGSTPEALTAIAAWSGYLIHRLKAWVNKFLPGREEIWVWERQKRGALHLHWSFVCLSKEVEERIRRGLKGEWIRLLESVSDRSGVDLFRKSQEYTHRGKGVAVVQVERVRKSVAGYLAKYLSKESFRASGFGDGGSILVAPSRWYGISKALHKKISERTREIRISYLNRREWLESYEDFLSLLSRIASWCHSDRYKFGEGRNIYARIDIELQERIWMDLENFANRFKRGSSASTGREAAALLAFGVRLIEKNPRLRKRYCSERSLVCSDLERRYRLLRPLSLKEIIYLLSFLMLSFESFQRHVGNLSGTEKRWFLEVRDFLIPGRKAGLFGDPPVSQKKVAYDGVDKKIESCHSGTRPYGEQFSLFLLPSPQKGVAAGEALTVSNGRV